MSTLCPPTIFVLIPAYKAAAHLGAFLDTLAGVVPKDNILVIDDAGNDGTPELCAKRSISCVAHSINQGKGAALKTGFAILIQKGASWIITMDADGQHAASDLPAFYTAISNNPDAGIVCGNRKKIPGTMPLSRIFSNRTTSGIMSLFCKQKIDDVQCGYRAYNAVLINRIDITYSRFEMESEVVLKSCALDMNVCSVPIQTIYDKHISSHISHLRDTIRWIRAVVSTSKNLRIARRTS